MKRIAPCPVSTVIRRFLSLSGNLRRRRVVVTGVGAITPLGPTMDSTWKAVLQTKDDSGNRRSHNSGITSLYSALKQQNLSTEQFEKVCAQINVGIMVDIRRESNIQLLSVFCFSCHYYFTSYVPFTQRNGKCFKI